MLKNLHIFFNFLFLYLFWQNFISPHFSSFPHFFFHGSQNIFFHHYFIFFFLITIIHFFSIWVTLPNPCELHFLHSTKKPKSLSQSNQNPYPLLIRWIPSDGYVPNPIPSNCFRFFFLLMFNHYQSCFKNTLLIVLLLCLLNFDFFMLL